VTPDFFDRAGAQLQESGGRVQDDGRVRLGGVTFLSRPSGLFIYFYK
jgi:hypothetical protein